MTISTFGDVAFVAEAARSIVRASAGRVIGREIHARRSVRVSLLGLDDSTIATFGHERSALEETGRRPFPL